MYKLKLTTLSPIYIGDGKKLTKKEYIQDGQIIYVPDLPKMYQGLRSMNLQNAYEDYMILEQRTRLSQWMTQNRVGKDKIQSWTKYKLNCDIDRSGRTEVEINTFIKDAFGNPYVPGSSLKGALRTILLAYIIEKNSTDYEVDASNMISDARYMQGSQKKYLQLNKKNIETKAFHTLNRLHEKPKDIDNAVNDMMSCLRISDSRPISVNQLTVCPKMDMSKNGTFKTINTLRECIKPGTEIEFDLTLDANFPFSIEEIKEAVKIFATSYSKCFYKYFRTAHRDLPKLKVNTIWLGGGAGYVSKTLTYPLLGYNQGLRTTANILANLFDNRRNATPTHGKDVENGVSPHMLKCTKFEGKVYEFGQCALKIEE